ncbi:ATP-binding protein [Rivibacter subsaxonicus]|uniref:Putative ATPase n=1 Tax=Rivibacter subsaxonicus TaxID=457575 RepID=A0A4Q7VPG9_9BURK|nr:winged helix-turn-helix domain-containing protein [Rivibacter subsaxonicus]RZT98087.1 putative ATPase [Rivibacter subsaxonicus]
MPPDTADTPLRFGRFEISPTERLLRVDDRAAALGARAFDVLLALAQRRERLVAKQELLDLVWPGVVVEEHNIAAQISSLRKVLGPDVIATVPGRGYRFTATLEVSTNGAQAGVAAPAQQRHNLPEQRTRFIGREVALAELGRLLPQTRLLTLVGIGGCGKTRLALHFARQQLANFADGVWFIDLAPLEDPQRVPSACASALDLGTESDAALPDQLAAHLAERQALVVLDNCEHVREGASALVDALLAHPGRSRILATSREPLAVAGEQLYPVRSLSLPATADLDEIRAADAVRVFVARARLALPEFEVGAGNASALVEICRRLDGIALAIELAAARVTMLSVFDIAARLEDRFRLLTGGASAAARQQTLLATMQWSYDLLDPHEQRLLRQLAVFVGGCTLEAATAIAQAVDEYELLMRLTALHDKSLLTVEGGAAGDAGSRPRYQMLETTRQYAKQRLDESGETDAALARHAWHFLALAEAAAPHLQGPQQSLWMARLRDEHENLVAAMNWCARTPDPVGAQCCLRLAAATGRYWLFNDVELGCRLTLDALGRDPDAADSEAHFQTLRGLAAMFMHRGQGEVGQPHARAALAMAQRLGVVEWQAMAHSAIGTCLGRMDEEEEMAALRHYEQARDLAQASGSALPLGVALNNIATIDFRHGRLEPAEQSFRQSLHLARARGDIRLALIVLHNLLRVLVAARRHADAHACAVEAELLLRGVGEDVLRFELLEVAAGLASSQGQHELAARFWGVARPRYTDAGYRRPFEDEAHLTRLRAGARQALGELGFEKAEAAGRTLALDAAMLELRQWLERPLQ